MSSGLFLSSCLRLCLLFLSCSSIYMALEIKVYEEADTDGIHSMYVYLMACWVTRASRILLHRFFSDYMLRPRLDSVSWDTQKKKKDAYKMHAGKSEAILAAWSPAILAYIMQGYSSPVDSCLVWFGGFRIGYRPLSCSPTSLPEHASSVPGQDLAACRIAERFRRGL